MKDPIPTAASVATKAPDNYTLELKSGEFLEVLNEDIIKILSKNDRVLIQAYPGTGKTSLIANWFADRTNVPFDKIVFMSPLLVIQDQFKSRVEKNDGQIDLELNYKSHKVYKFGDKNITSTYKSLFKIENELNEDDLIVVDEAHMLLNAFREGKLVDVYGFTALILRRTKAKILFLSATPGETLKDMFKYKIFKVSSLKIQSKIEFYRTSGNYLQFAVWFAKNALERQGHDKLNIIYYNNKSGLERFKDLLENELNCNCTILSSDAKNTEDYEEVIREFSIGQNVQFLLATSIISAGASILNENIGEALIFDNHDPIDFFQFSKRFRNKTALPITLVNRYSWDENEYSEKDMLKSNILPTREYYNKFLDELNQMDGEGDLSFDRTYHNNNIGTKDDLLIRTMTRLLIEECHYKEQLTERFKNSDELKKALRVLDFKIIDGSHPTFDKDSKFGEFVSKKEREKYLKFIERFTGNIEAYLSAIDYFAINDMDLNTRNLYALIKDRLKFERNIHSDGEINDLKNTFFLSKILVPFLKFFSFFNDPSKTLEFMSHIVETKKRNKALIQINFCSVFNSFFEQSSTHSKPILRMDINYNAHSPKEALMITFISKLLDFLERKPYYDHESLKRTFISEVLVPQEDLVNEFPFEHIDICYPGTKEGYKIKEIRKVFTSGLFEGLIYTDKKRIQPKQRGLPKNPKIPKQELDGNTPSNQDIDMWTFNEFKITKTKKICRIYFNTSDLILDSLTK